MKKLVYLTLVLACTTVLMALSSHALAFRFNPAHQPFVSHANSDAPRYPAPDFTLKDLGGTQVSLSDYQGSVVAMMFWTTW